MIRLFEYNIHRNPRYGYSLYNNCTNTEKDGHLHYHYPLLLRPLCVLHTSGLGDAA